MSPINPTLNSSYTWQVYSDQVGPFWEITLTYNRQRPDGTYVKFDEDPNGVLDLATGADKRLVMEGFLTLIFNGELLSCSLRAIKHKLPIWTRPYHQHVFAGYDKQKIANEFASRLWNPDSSVDFLLVGGEQTAHTTLVIQYWTKILMSGLFKSSGKKKLETLAQALNVYREIFYTQTTEIHLWTQGEESEIIEMRNRLAQTAAQFGLVLPAEFGKSQSI